MMQDDPFGYIYSLATTRKWAADIKNNYQKHKLSGGFLTAGFFNLIIHFLNAIIHFLAYQEKDTFYQQSEKTGASHDTMGQQKL